MAAGEAGEAFQIGVGHGGGAVGVVHGGGDDGGDGCPAAAVGRTVAEVGDVFQGVGGIGDAGDGGDIGIDAGSIDDHFQRAVGVEAVVAGEAESVFLKVIVKITVCILRRAIIATQLVLVLPFRPIRGLDFHQRNVVVDHQRITGGQLKGEVVSVGSSGIIQQVTGFARVLA